MRRSLLCQRAGRQPKFDQARILEAWALNQDRPRFDVAQPRLSMRRFAEVQGISLRHLRRLLRLAGVPVPPPSALNLNIADLAVLMAMLGSSGDKQPQELTTMPCFSEGIDLEMPPEFEAAARRQDEVLQGLLQSP